MHGPTDVKRDNDINKYRIFYDTLVGI